MIERIHDKWMKHFPKGWWGDWLDVRFYLAGRLQRLHDKKILDIACNAGMVLSEIPEDNQTYGIDLDAKALKAAKAIAPKAKTKKASMYKLPYPKASFDAVVCANVLPGADFVFHGNRLKPQKKLMKEVKRVLKKGGKLYLTTPNDAFYHDGKETLQELEQILDGFDYTLQGWNPFPRFPFFLPARLLVRIPGWFSLLRFLSEKGFFRRTSKYFYVEATPFS
ncbi:class I SAM-dependent methyltransferase [Candidatus Micrarchaeota archaeon]|nr:class I SAM-dependent methyltransferase [Candidatus Micrarchaeota archaeon]